VIVGVIIAIGIVLAMIIFSTQYLPQLASEALQQIMAPFMQMVDQSFLFLATFTPIITAVIPLYILRHRDDRIMILGALYGLALMFIMLFFGLDQTVIDYFRSSWGTSWISALGTVAPVIYAVIFWIWGAFLYILDLFLAGLIGLSRPAKWLQVKVKTQKRKWKEKRKG
jgi:hypothetical protein